MSTDQAAACLSAQRIGIVGAGAIGGFLAAHLARTGHRVAMLARGETLHALRAQGLRFVDRDGQQQVVRVRACADVQEMGKQDLVILAVKGQVLSQIAASLAPLISASSVVLTVGNGLPWWYFLFAGHPLQGMRLKSVDPDGSIERALPLGQVLGASVMASCHCPTPGTVVHSSGGRIVLGEPTGDTSARAARWTALLQSAGLDAMLSVDIRQALWIKLLGNMCANPLSLLTEATTDRLLDDPGTRSVFAGLMSECIVLGRRVGLPLDVDIEARMAQTRALGAIKTSMLQDLEAGRSVELDAIMGAPFECAKALGLEMPRIEMVLALARMRAARVSLAEKR